MQERPARLEFQSLRRPVRMRGPQARDPKLDSRLVQVADHPQLLRRRHALETLDLDRVKRFEHDGGNLTPAMPERLDFEARRSLLHAGT